MAKVAEIMAELESLGTEQNRKIYARHGAQLPMFGVSFANFGKLKKRLKVDHDLALGLWRTGNQDARILATLIADPARMDVATAGEWVRGCRDYGLTDAICRPIGASPAARVLAEKWLGSDDEWLGTAGWNLIAILTSDASLSDAYFEPYLDLIERTIHGRKNRTRYAMNNALIAIGIRSDVLRRKAVAAAERIGEVNVDHGETGCRTPDAASYIRKAVAYRKERAAIAAAKGSSKAAAPGKGAPRRANAQHPVSRRSARQAAGLAKGAQRSSKPAARSAASQAAAKKPRTRAASVRHRIRKPSGATANGGGRARAASKTAASRRTARKPR